MTRMKRNRLHGAALAALLSTLAACGGGGNSSNDLAGTDGGDAVARLNARDSQSAAGAQDRAQPGQGTADAEGLNCNLSPPSGPDVVGVTIGMSADDAYRAIACSNRALRVTVSERGGFGPPALPDGRRLRNSIVGEAEGERIEAALSGLPGAERVVTIRRSVTFAPGQEPARDALIQQLQGKYGTLTHDSREYGRWSGTTIRAPNGQPVPPNTLLQSRCALSVGMLAGPPDLQGDCGHAVAVRIEESGNNPELAARLIVSMNDGAYGMRQVEAVRAQANATAQGQRAQEVEQARGRAPNL